MKELKDLQSVNGGEPISLCAFALGVLAGLAANALWEFAGGMYEGFTDDI